MLKIRDLKSLPQETIMFAIDKDNNSHKLLIDEKSVTWIKSKVEKKLKGDSWPSYTESHTQISEFTDTVIVSDYSFEPSASFNISIDKLYTTAKGARMANREKKRIAEMQKTVMNKIDSKLWIKSIISKNLNLSKLSEEEQFAMKVWLHS